MKRRSFLAMLGFAPVAGAVAAASTDTLPPDLSEQIVVATSPDSAIALACENIGTTRVIFVADQFIMPPPTTEPLKFDVSGRLCRTVASGLR